MRKALTRNWQLKVVSLVIAFGLWAFVATSEKGEIALAAPVEYVSLDPDLVLVGPRRDSVEVQVQTPRWTLAHLGRDSLRVRVNLANAREGDMIVQLSPDQVQAPPGVMITRISPARLRLTLAHAITAVLRVVPHLRGAPAPGFAVHRVAVEPATVQVKGPRSTIEGRGSVETLPVDIADSQATVAETVGLVLPDETFLTGERTVQVTVEIREESMRQGNKKGTSR